MSLLDLLRNSQAPTNGIPAGEPEFAPYPGGAPTGKPGFGRPEIALAMMGIGSGMSALGMGQAPDLSKYAGQIMAVKQGRGGAGGGRSGGGSGGVGKPPKKTIMDRIASDPNLRAAILAMPPELAEKMITDAMLADAGLKAPEEPEPVKGVVVDGKLINPHTGEEIYGGTPEPEKPLIIGGAPYNLNEDGSLAPTPGFVPAPDYPSSYEEHILAQEDPLFADYLAQQAMLEGGGSNFGKIPEGTVRVPDPNAPGGYRIVPLDGSDAARAAAEAEKKAGLQEGARDTSTTTIVNAATRALDANSKRVADGAIGAIAALNPASPNAEVYRQVDALKSINSFQQLNAMRQSSPTGGALGNVTERELDLLSLQAGALDPASPHFERDLKDYTRALLEVIHGPDAGRQIFEATMSGGKPAANPAATPEMGRFGSMSKDELLNFDLSTLDPSEFDAFEAAARRFDK